MKDHNFRIGLGTKMFIMSVIAFAVAVCIYFLTFNIITAARFNDDGFDPYWNNSSKTAIESFQEYVTEKGLSVEQAIADVEWEEKHPTMFMYFSSYPETYIDEHGHRILDGTKVYCSDGEIYAFAFFFNNEFYDNAIIIAILTSAICFSLIMLPYLYYIVRRIRHLKNEMGILTGGDLNYRISVYGRDELSELGRNIEEMRLSVLEQIKRENEAVVSKNNLITSLSHDLRTPLARLFGYLEILRLKNTGENEEQMRFLNLSIENAERMKELLDELFHSVRKEDSGTAVSGAGKISDSILLSKLISEMVFDLKTAGFSVIYPEPGQAFRISLPEADLKRIFENIFSNIMKYADRSKEVSVCVKCSSSHVEISVQNGTSENVRTYGTGLGIPSIKQLAERCGGKVQMTVSEALFCITITLPASFSNYII